MTEYRIILDCEECDNIDYVVSDVDDEDDLPPIGTIWDTSCNYCMECGGTYIVHEVRKVNIC